MTESIRRLRVKRCIIYPELMIAPEKLVRQENEDEDEIYDQRCRAIFERVRPKLIDKYYGWHIAVEPDSGEYLLEEDNMQAHKKALEKYPNADHCVFCLNETGAVGRI